MPHCLYRLDVIDTDNTFSSQNSVGTSKEITCKEITCKEITCKIELSFHRKRFAAGVPSRQHSHERVTYGGGKGVCQSTATFNPSTQSWIPLNIGVSKLTNGRVQTSRGDLGSHT